MADVKSNLTSSPDSFQTTYLEIRDMQTKLLPFICGLGFITNVLSLFIFLQPSLRRLSCSVYLAAKAVTDFVFLLTVFIIWLARVDVGAFHTQGICQLVIFFSYLTAFISIWLAVVLTVENLLCVLKPWYVQRSCNASSATLITLLIVLCGIILYQFALWNNGLRSVEYPPNVQGENISKPIQVIYKVNITDGFDNNNTVNYTYSLAEYQDTVTQYPPSIQVIRVSNVSEPQCVPLHEFQEFAVAMAYIDSLVTLLFPLLILAFTNAAIVIIAVRASRRRRRLLQQKRQYNLPGTHLSTHRKSSASLETQASRFLFSVSMTLLLFHLPSHVIRLRLLLGSYTAMGFLLQRMFETLYYTHYSIGFFVYLIFGSNFRRVFFSFCRKHYG